MVFSSLTFLYIFLPINLVLYYLTKNAVFRNIILILFSFVFYAWGEPLYVFLLLATATLDYLNGLFIDTYRNTVYAKWGVAFTLITNLGVLGLFKYSDFVIGNINALIGTQFKEPGWGLPIGISFYTFQTISYVIDVYRNHVPVQRSWGKFMLFVSLYHQLVAGPIVRYADIANEIDNRIFDAHDVGKGILRFCIGLFKKIAIANIAGELVLHYMGGDLSELTIGGAWFGLIMFSVQIYFDFSAYSDMAIGLGWMFGFHYLENFNYPYIAKSATEFWRRWHISLGTFFRDYVYIPLGGKEKRAYLNLFIVWFLTGLWHGASWNFILWGLYFGCLIAIERLFLNKILGYLPRVFAHLYLIFIAIIGWALFYFENLNDLNVFLQRLFINTNGYTDFLLEQHLKENIFWLVFTAICCLPVYHICKNWTLKYWKLMPGAVAWSFVLMVCLALLVISTSLLVGKSYNPFIYYRF
jgi:alginate O-acetyltransferase complex protein AlgI